MYTAFKTFAVALAIAVLALDATRAAAAPAKQSPAKQPPAAASAAPAIPAPGGVSFKAQVVPLLSRSCAGCHAPGRKGWRDLVLFDEAGKLLYDPVHAELDWIIETVAAGHGKPRLTATEVALLQRWHDEGGRSN